MSTFINVASHNNTRKYEKKTKTEWNEYFAVTGRDENPHVFCVHYKVNNLDVHCEEDHEIVCPNFYLNHNLVKS